MNKALTLMLIAGLGHGLLAGTARAQARRGGEKPAEVRRPAPAARTPSLSPPREVRPVAPPRPVAPRINAPVTVNQHIQLPTNIQRPIARPVTPQPLVTLPKREVGAAKTPVVVERRPGTVPGAVVTIPEHKAGAQTLGGCAICHASSRSPAR